MAWAYGSYVGGRLLVLVATAVLARLLTPEEFGVVGFALTFIALLEGVANLGLGQALIVQDDEDFESRANTVFITSIVLGAILSAIVAAASPLVADFFSEPQLVGIVCALGANFFLRSLGITHYSIAQRNLDFRARTVAELSDVVVRGLAGIGLALAGFGAWSLVLGYLGGTVAMNLALFATVRWRPRLGARRSHLREMLGFGTKLSGVDVTAALIDNVDNLFVGRILGPNALGLYTMAFRLPELVIQNLAIVAGQVLYPAFAAASRDAMQRSFLVSTRFTWLIALPSATLMAILAEPVIVTLFGDQWRSAADAMRVLAVLSFLVAVSVPPGTVYKATGRAGLLLALGVARLVAVTAALAVFVGDGITAAAACQAAIAAVWLAVGTLISARILGTGLRVLAAETVPALLVSAAIAPVLLAATLIEPEGLACLAGVGGAALVFTTTLRLLAPETLSYLLDRLRDRRDPPDPPAASPMRETDVIA